MTALAPTAATIEDVLIQGDLSKFSAQQRVEYVLTVCDRLGLNPYTQPFKYLVLDGKLTLYATKDCTDQLRKVHGVSVVDITATQTTDLYVVVAKVKDRDGRDDASTGVVAIGALKGNALANAIMRAETKAKRRATLSICGLGVLDESETDTIRGVSMDTQATAVSLPLLAQAEPNPNPVPPLQLPPPATEPRVFCTCVITQALARQAGPVTWAEVTFTGVDEKTGEELTLTLPTMADARDAPLKLAEQLYEECKAGRTVTIETAIGARNKKEAIVKFSREQARAEQAVPVTFTGVDEKTGGAGDITADDIGF